MAAANRQKKVEKNHRELKLDRGKCFFFYFLCVHRSGIELNCSAAKRHEVHDVHEDRRVQCLTLSQIRKVISNEVK